MRRVRWWVLVGSLSAAAPARADDTAQRDAQVRFEEGVARLRANNLSGALLSFQQAYAVAHNPVVVWNLALTEEKTSRALDALEHFKEYLRVTPISDPDRVKAQNHIDELNAATGHIDVEAPAGAAITLDGTLPLGAAPLPDRVDVLPGHHDLEARFGTVVKTAGVDALAGRITRADFSALEGTASTAGPSSPQSSAPPPDLPVEPPPVPEQASGASSSSTARWVTVVVVGSAAVLASGVALGYGIASTHDANMAATLRQQVPTCAGVTSPDCQSLASDVSDQQNDHVISTAMWIVGGTLAVGAVGAFLLWPKHRTGGVASTLVPLLGPRSAGLGTAWAF
jgi:hypothetical protein